MLYQVELLPPQSLIIAICWSAHCLCEALEGCLGLRGQECPRLHGSRYSDRCSRSTTDRLSAHAHVLESHGAQARGVEQVLGVDDDRALH
jgi:hypothetical protein